MDLLLAYTKDSRLREISVRHFVAEAEELELF